MKKVIFLLVLLGCLYFSSRILLSWHRPNSSSADRVSFTIERGMNLKNISLLLKEKNVIRDPLVFRLYARYHGLSEKLQAGEYVVLRNLTLEELFDILQTGKTSEIRVTIPEGATIAQIDDILAKKSLISPGEFIKCTQSCDLGFSLPFLEGYLFPSTYYVNPNTFTPKGFLLRLYNTLQTQIEPFRADILSQKRTLEQVIIMASLIEREANTKAEMPKISHILWKRLDEGIALGVDATTRYALNDWKSPLASDDFDEKFPYDTRRRKGLPPTAIANPGIDALKAAIYPEENPYYYYLHDSKGNIHFAETHEEHIRNKEKYLR